jgi:hypothetical protein
VGPVSHISTGKKAVVIAKPTNIPDSTYIFIIQSNVPQLWKISLVMGVYLKAARDLFHVGTWVAELP